MIIHALIQKSNIISFIKDYYIPHPPKINILKNISKQNYKRSLEI